MGKFRGEAERLKGGEEWGEEVTFDGGNGFSAEGEGLAVEVEEGPEDEGEGHTGRLTAADGAVADDAVEVGLGHPEGEDAGLFF